MADKPIGQLESASEITLADLFVLQQDNKAKSITGALLVSELADELDGHGGISTISLVSSSGLIDTYRITYAGDGTSSTYTVTNGKAISSVSKTSAVPPSLTDTYRINYNDNTHYDFSVDNGRGISSISWTSGSGTAGDGLEHIGTILYNDGTSSSVVFQDGVKGDTGDGTYTYIRYASQQPISDEDMSIDPDKWIGIYTGSAVSAPSTYTSYTWYQFKGDNGIQGVGISGVYYDSTSNLTNTYRIEFSDGTSTTFDVENGSSIDSIELDSSNGLVDTYNVLLTNGSSTTFDVTNGKGISNVTMISGSHSPGSSDIYRLTFNDGDTFDYPVYNGSNGAGSVSTVDDIQPVTGNVPLLIVDDEPPTSATVGTENQRYIDTVNRMIYYCAGGAGGSYTWIPLGNMYMGNGSPTTATVGFVGQQYYNLNDGVLYVCTNVSGSTYTWAGSGVVVDSALSTNSAHPVENQVITAKVGTDALSGFNTATNLSQACNEVKGDVNGKVSAAGDTMTGELDIKSSSLTSGTRPGATTAGTSLAWTDSANATIAQIYPRFLTDGKQGVVLRSGRYINGQGKYNQLILYVDENGDNVVTLSDSNAWLDALGLNTITTETTVGNIANASSPFSITAASFSTCGKMAMLYLTVKNGATAITGDGTTTQVATINSGKRPPVRAAAVVVNATTATYNTPLKAYINAGGGVNVVGAVNASQTFYISATYILA